MTGIVPSMQFSSDGWRAIIADTFTFANLRRLVWAIGHYLRDTQASQPIRVLVAHDTRFMGEAFARAVADTLGALGISSYLVDYPITTPLLSWYTYYKKYDIGLIVTASHNPPYYNGLKIRMPYGGPPSEEVMHAIKHLIPESSPEVPRSNGTIETIDPKPAYIEKIRNMLDLPAIDQAEPVVAVDSMHGTTAGLLRDILAGTRAKVIPVRENPDPLFGGIPPEPKANTIGPLIETVKREGCRLGVAHDGDGDRIVAVDPEYGYLSPNDLITLLVYDLAQRRGLPGSIVASVSTTCRVKRVADHIGRLYREVPIGFRHAAKIMREETVLLAGEENGGIGIGLHMPERDGTLAAALLVELISSRENGLGAFLLSLERLLGGAKFLRKDIQVTRPPKRVIDCFGRALPESVSGLSVIKCSTVDGIKLYLENGSWFLVRAAGTEPLIRIYAEADTLAVSENIINEVSARLFQLSG